MLFLLKLKSGSRKALQHTGGSTLKCRFQSHYLIEINREAIGKLLREVQSDPDVKRQAQVERIRYLEGGGITLVVKALFNFMPISCPL